jgi:hypothetical protein
MHDACIMRLRCLYLEYVYICDIILDMFLMLGMCWGEEGVLGGGGRRRRRIYSYNGSVNKSFIVPGERIHNRLPSLYF